MEANKRIRLKIASPCNADWDSMKGDEAVRFCAACHKSVYQLSNMSTEQVENLLGASGEDRCVRFFQRKDGTVMTNDCSVGLRRTRRKQAALGAGLGALSALGVSLVASGSTGRALPYLADEGAPSHVEHPVHELGYEAPVVTQPEGDPQLDPEPTLPDIDENQLRPLMGAVAYIETEELAPESESAPANDDPTK